LKKYISEDNTKEQADLIWRSFVKGRKWAFSKLYEQNYHDLYFYGIKFISNENELRDLIHDFFIKIWNHRSNLSKPKNITAYLLRGLRGIILDYLKVYKSRHVLQDIDENISFTTKNPETLFIENQTVSTNHKALFKALDELSHRQKEAVYLHYIKAYSYPEVAEIMSINIQSVRSLVYEAINALKNKKNLFE
jgi:RNA polymerase sigma factor (sigma-70 family)